MGRTGEALERDLELGDTDWEYLESDPWFDSIRDHPRYLEIVRSIGAATEG